MALLSVAAVSCSHVVREGDLFHPRRHAIEPEEPGRSNVEIAVDRETTLRGWYLNAPEHRRTVIYCYGNAETVLATGQTLAWLSRTAACNVLAVDYRGYGFSEGTPSLAAMISDGPRIYDHLRDSLGVTGPVFVFGRSIGTGMATAIASERPVAGLIMEAPPSSIADVIPTWRERFPWYARAFVSDLRPDDSIASFRPQPIDNIRRVTAPLLVIHGTADDVIPVRFGRKMFDSAASQQKEWLAVEGAGHNDLWISRPPASERLIDFIQRNSSGE